MTRRENESRHSSVEASTLATWERNLIGREEKTWERDLGVPVAILPLPSFLTPFKERLLRNFGLKLRFFPALDLAIDNLGVLSKGDFWEKVRKGEIRLPPFPGYWLAIEDLPKPNYGHRYKNTLLASRLEILNRFTYNPIDIEKRVKEKRNSILSTLDLPQDTEIRLPEAIEWDLLRNRQNWGKTTSYEWTNTAITTNAGKVERVIIGGKDSGKTSLFFLPAHESNDMVGFRLVFILRTKG